MSLLDNKNYLKKIDSSNMLGSVDFLPRMFEEAKEVSPLPPIPISHASIKNIIISGMGGSAIAGDIVKTSMERSFEISKPVPIFINRDYVLPSWASQDSLVFLNSYSGNTEETISAYEAAKKIGAKRVIITSGGKLAQQARTNKDPLFLIPSGFPPRAALAYLLIPIFSALFSLGLYPRFHQDLEAVISRLKKLKKKYSINFKINKNPAKQMALELFNNIPLIFATRLNDGAALRWKTQFNENSKTTAFLNLFPELNHNEIVNLGRLKKTHNFALIILRDQEESSRLKKRIEITKELLKPAFKKIYEIWAEGETPFEKISSLIIFGDYLSVYCALLKGIDPTAVEIITRLKEKLKD